jgi:hypothetical protein
MIIFSVALYRYTPYDAAIPHPRNPTKCLKRSTVSQVNSDLELAKQPNPSCNKTTVLLSLCISMSTFHKTKIAPVFVLWPT